MDESNRRFFLRGKSIGRAIVLPFQRFAAIEASSGIALVVATLAGFAWANSPIASSYQALFHTEIAIGIAGRTFERSIHFWINDGLMTIFFFLVGLEIKREVLVGELSSFGKAALPAVAALGGMVVPAGLYMLLNHGTSAASGWAIPMATDIAFVVGSLALVGRGLPSFLPVFLVSLAIFDDLGAVLVIALFYGGHLQAHFLVLASLVLIALVLLNILGFRWPLPYVILGILLWVCTYLSGVHPTIAGVLLALSIPARSGWNTSRFAEMARIALRRFVPEGDSSYALHLSEQNQEVIEEIEGLLERVEPPLQRIERTLHPYVSFGVMPLFALANCGIPVDGSVLWDSVSSPPSLGILLGLFVGKQVGVFGATWLFIRSGLGVMPEGMSWKHLYGGALLCGIGFTMSLFIADLSFTNQHIHESAKMSILLASFASGFAGIFMLWISRNDGGTEKNS
jgi:Na+:H+ antiporter, NhaA family